MRADPEVDIMKTDDEGPNGTAFYDEEELGGKDFDITILALYLEVSIKKNEWRSGCGLCPEVYIQYHSDAEGGLDVGSDTGDWKLTNNLSSYISIVDVIGLLGLVIIDHLVLAKREERLRRKIAWRKHVNMFTRRRHLTTKKKKVSTMSRSSTAANDLSKKSK